MRLSKAEDKADYKMHSDECKRLKREIKKADRDTNRQEIKLSKAYIRKDSAKSAHAREKAALEIDEFRFNIQGILGAKKNLEYSLAHCEERAARFKQFLKENDYYKAS